MLMELKNKAEMDTYGNQGTDTAAKHAINDAGADCTQFFTRFHKEHRTKNGVDPSAMPIERALMVNGVYEEKTKSLLPRPENQKLKMLE
jgi:hypothetical protein